MENRLLVRPSMPKIGFVLFLLGLSSAAYAAFLNTDEGRQFAEDYTTFSVVAGNSLILLFLRMLLPRYYWNIVALSFVVAGSSMITRHINNKP
jgi:hypothetical protein